jgi:hypothetical protein
MDDKRLMNQKYLTGQNTGANMFTSHVTFYAQKSNFCGGTLSKKKIKTKPKSVVLNFPHLISHSVAHNHCRPLH